MFAPRFDPEAVNVSPVVADVVDSKKRKLSTTSIEEDESESSSSDSSSSDSSSSDSSSDSESSSASSSDSSSESDSDSDSDSDSETDSSTDTDAEVGSNNGEDVRKETIDDDDEMKVDQEELETTVENDPEYVSKHHSVFQKFSKSVPETLAEHPEAEDDDNMDIVETQDLAPLPQPQLPRDKRLAPKTTHVSNLDWLATPTYASPEQTKPFADFKNPGLSSFMLRNLKNLGFENAFSVQIAVLDTLLKDMEKNKIQPDMRGDLLVNASTGSGKTLAYLIPIIESLHSSIVPRVRAIILVPTKPLISQVKSTLNQLSKGTNLSVVSLKNDISIKDEGEKLQANIPDIIVSTPGRLVDHLANGSISLKSLRFLVIDEADRLLNQSFQNWCQILISEIEKHNDGESNIATNWKLNVQKLIFSATLTTDAGRLSLLKFHKPRLVIVNDQQELVNELFNVPNTLNEYKIQFGSAKSSLKPLILSKFLLSRNKLSNVLIFTKSNDSSLRLSRLLSLIMNKLTKSQTINIAYINSTNNTVSARSKILKDFTKQSVNILVATDLIARGIDILSITDVVNYDLPNSSREYVHRVGRTARANQSGNAYSFCFGKGEGKWFKSLLSQVGRAQKSVEDLEIDSKALVDTSDEMIYKEALDELQKQVFNRS